MNFNNLFASNLTLASTSILGSIVILACIYKWKTRPRYGLVAEISKLHIYPFKGLPGIQVPFVEITPFGLKHGVFRDRMWVIKGPNGRHVSPIEEPSLLLIKPQFKEKQLWLDADGMETLKLDILSESDQVEGIKIFGPSTKGLVCGKDATEWFQKFLKTEEIQILQYIDNFERPSTDPLNTTNNSKIVYQSGSAVSLLSEASVEDLNGRINIKVYDKNFRPNVVVKGNNKPYEEDTWKKMKIGEDVELIRAKPCERCVMTTIDPYTGKKDSNMEPLRTLRTYRLVKNPILRKIVRDIPIFAIDCGVVKPGIVSIGDPVFSQSDNFIY